MPCGPPWNVLDLDESNVAVPDAHPSATLHAVLATQRSAEPVSRMTFNACGLYLYDKINASHFVENMGKNARRAKGDTNI